jgi:hypothetical protein
MSCAKVGRGDINSHKNCFIRVVERCYTVKYSIDGCIDINCPSIFVIPNHPVTKAYADMKNRDIRIRFISEIKDNLRNVDKVS